MKLLITGGTGYVGSFLVAEALRAGDDVTLMGRRKPDDPRLGWLPFDLGQRDVQLPAGYDALIHAAFDHLPGKYRGGEGDDPEGFMARNRDGAIRLFRAARQAQVGRIVFLSTRAVYGDYPPGTALTEDLQPRPETLYGQMKWDCEQALASLAGPGLIAASLRVTGVYGAAYPGGPHKWQELFSDFDAARPIDPRAGTEVHGDDVADAVRLILDATDLADSLFNLSDLRLDRHDLLTAYQQTCGGSGKIPERSVAPGPNEMSCDRIRALGWTPGGWQRLEKFLAEDYASRRLGYKS